MFKRRKPKSYAPVIRVSDPAELAKIAANHHIASTNTPIPCTGNKITVLISSQKKEVDDNYILSLLKKDKDAPKPKLQPGERKTLIGLRIALSNKGKDSFTEAHKQCLADLLSKLEKQFVPLPLKEIERRIMKIKSINVFLNAKRKNIPIQQYTLEELFSKEKLDSVIARISEILKPYGMKDMSKPYVYAYAVSNIDYLASGRDSTYLFSELFNPESNSYFEKIIDLPSLPSKLEKELEGVKTTETAIVREKLGLIMVRSED